MRQERRPAQGRKGVEGRKGVGNRLFVLINGSRRLSGCTFLPARPFLLDRIVGNRRGYSTIASPSRSTMRSRITVTCDWHSPIKNRAGSTSRSVVIRSGFFIPIQVTAKSYAIVPVTGSAGGKRVSRNEANRLCTTGASCTTNQDPAQREAAQEYDPLCKMPSCTTGRWVSRPVVQSQANRPAPIVTAELAGRGT